jgi:phage RecT family recombinase
MRDRVFRQLDLTAEYMPPWFMENAARFCSLAAVEAIKLQTAHPDVDVNSIKIAIFNAATLGLMLGPTMGHGYLVPFLINKGKPQQRRIVQLIVGYKGYIELAFKSDWLAGLTTELVLKEDKFRRWNSIGGTQIEHELALGRKEVWPNVLAAYCMYRTKAGYTNIVIVQRDELQRLKSRQKNVWDSDPIPMCLKTPVRRAAKLWQLTRELGGATCMDNCVEAGIEQPALEQFEFPEESSALPLVEGELSPIERKFNGERFILGADEEFEHCGTVAEVGMVLARRTSEVPAGFDQALIDDAIDYLAILAKSRAEQLGEQQ